MRPSWRWFWALLAAWLQGAAAATPALPDAELFFSHPAIADAKLSPSGQWLAMKVGTANGRYAVVAFDLNGSKTIERVADFSNVDVDDFHWVNDERLVFDIVDLTRGSGDRRWGPGLFSVRRDGSELRHLVATRHSFFAGTALPGVRKLNMYHQLLHVPAGGGEGGNEVIVGEWEFDATGEPLALRPKRLDVVTGGVQQLVRGMPDHAIGWLFDRSGAPRLAEVLRDGRVRVYWRADLADQTLSAWKQIADWPLLQPGWEAEAVDPDGDLYVSIPEGAAGASAITRFDFASGKPLRPALVSTPGFDIGAVVAEVRGDTLLGLRVLTAAESTVWADPALKALQAEIDRRLPGRVNRLSCRRCEHPDRTVLVRSWSDREPAEYWLWRGEASAAKAWTLLGAERKGIAPQRMGTLELQRFAARDGLVIPLWLTLPPGHQRGRPAPAVVLVHGGPWLRGGYWRWSAMSQFLASRGYVVIEPEFRGSTGYGSVHFRAGWKQWGRAMQDDLADAVAHVAAQGLIDPARVCIAGASYGGYATLMGLARHPDLYRCGAAWVAVSEPALLFKGGWNTDTSEQARVYTLPQLLGDPDTDAALLRDASAVVHAARIKAPLLLAYGAEDLRVPLDHGKRIRSALQALGREPTWVLYDGEGHYWQRTQTRVDFARRLEQFLALHLR